MTFTAGVPVFPSPSDQYDPQYMTDLIRATLVLTNLPTSGAQLETGSVYNDNGTLKIVLPNIGYGSAVTASSSIGTVTVTTS